jgi:hypothetical protein
LALANVEESLGKSTKKNIITNGYENTISFVEKGVQLHPNQNPARSRSYKI